jgi:hypothetical protein
MLYSITDFWTTIDHCVNNDIEKQPACLTASFDKLSEENLAWFLAYHSQEYVRLDHFDVWAVAYTVIGGCSDDGFMDFRGWLILKGKNPCQTILTDPEALIPVFTSLDYSMETCLNFPDTYIENRFGGPIEVPDLGNKRNAQSPTVGVNFDPDDLESRFPMLWKAFN